MLNKSIYLSIYSMNQGVMTKTLPILSQKLIVHHMTCNFILPCEQNSNYNVWGAGIKNNNDKVLHLYVHAHPWRNRDESVENKWIQ